VRQRLTCKSILVNSSGTLVATATWTLSVTGDANASYVDVAYSDASGGTRITAGNCTDGANNTNWFFTNFHEHIYDAWNRLVKVTQGATTIAEYAYDGFRRRTLHKVYDGGSLDHTRHNYYSNRWQLLEERMDNSSNAAQQHVWGRRYIDDVVLRDRDTTNPANGTLDERLYTMQDANYNVTAIADTSGDVQERYAYTPYGEPKFSTPAFANRANSNFDWETLYAGYRRDGDTGEYFVRNRVYNTLLGIWLTRDPIGYKSDENLCAYVGGSPLVTVDPSGLFENIIVDGQTNPGASIGGNSHTGLPPGQSPSAGNSRSPTRGPIVTGRNVLGRAVCRVAVHCWQVPASGWLGTHCGLSVTDGYENYPEDYRLDGDGPPPWTNGITRDDEGHHENAGRFVSMPPSVCRCLNRYMTIFNNAPSIPYEPDCRNSNFTLRCLVTHCGIRINWGEWGSPPTGYNCRDKHVERCIPANPHDPSGGAAVISGGGLARCP